MIKHVGKHNQRRIAIVYRKVPDESHMALIVYTDALPMMVHDEMMKCLESDIGQQAKELADALFRTTMADGQNCLSAIHKGGWMKKVPTNQVIVTPTIKSTCRLDELNDIIDKIEAGGEAAQQLADMDANRGMRGVIQEGRELGQPAKPFTGVQSTTSADISGVLSDSDLAEQRTQQANKMEAEAKALLAEAKRLKQEATQLSQPKAKNVGKTKKATT
jgi:hypothetical protein